MASIPPGNGFPGLEFVQYEGATYAYVRQIWEAVYSDKYLVHEFCKPHTYIDYYKKYTSMYPTDWPGATVHCSPAKTRSKQGFVPLGDYGIRPRAIFAFFCSMLIKRVPTVMEKLCPLIAGLFGILFSKLTGESSQVQVNETETQITKTKQP